MNTIHIPKVDNRTEEIINNVVETLLSKKEQGLDTTAGEQRIDLMVYKLYELTWEEVRVVDPQLPFTREEYEGFEWESV